MKKVLIVLLSVLIALAFTSCDNDKSEDVITAYTEFVDGYNFCNYAFYTVKPYYAFVNGETNLAEKGKDKVDTTALYNLVNLNFPDFIHSCSHSRTPRGAIFLDEKR